MPKIFFLILPMLVVVTVSFFITSMPAIGAINNCSVTQKTRSMDSNQQQTLNFDITNQASTNIVWVKISAPSGFTINGAQASGFSVSVSSSEVVFSGGSINPTSNLSFQVEIRSGNSAQSPSSFSVQTSDTSNGDSPYACSGNTSVEITGQGLVVTLSNITVSDITATEATVTWNTSMAATSKVDVYNNGNLVLSRTNTNQATSHRIILTGLTPTTSYYYQVFSTDSSGFTASSGNNTFLTLASSTQTSGPAESPATTSGGSETTSGSINQGSSNSRKLRKPTNNTPRPTYKPMPDTQSPKAKVATNFEKSYRIAPKISGIAEDNEGIKSVDYSIDNGESWLPVTLKNEKSSRVEFDFTPQDLPDGNYNIRFRAKDLSGNIGVSDPETLVIDILPPQIGIGAISLGPHIINPNQNGEIFLLEGQEYKITLSSIGGPISIDLISSLDKKDAPERVFSLSKDKNNNLWGGIILFEGKGDTKLTAKTVDGNGNRSEKVINNLKLASAGQVLDGNKKAIDDALVSVFVFNPNSNSFKLWDGSSFGQNNPQKTDQLGKYKLILPEGKYYLEVKKPGYKKLLTKLFSVQNTSFVNSNFSLQPGGEINLGPLNFLFDIFIKKQAVELNNNLNPTGTNIDKKGLKIASLRIKNQNPIYDFSADDKSILTVLNSWSPQTFDQLKYLQEASSNLKLETVVVMPHESKAKVELFTKKGNYQIAILPDPEGKIIGQLDTTFVPTHYYLEKGVLQNIKFGLLSGQELLDN